MACGKRWEIIRSFFQRWKFEFPLLVLSRGCVRGDKSNCVMGGGPVSMSWMTGVDFWSQFGYDIFFQMFGSMENQNSLRKNFFSVFGNYCST